jgi:hypothetical protein
MFDGVTVKVEGGILMREGENLACEFSFPCFACRVCTGDLDAERC